MRALDRRRHLFAHGRMEKVRFLRVLDHQVEEGIDFRIDILRPVHNAKAYLFFAFRSTAHLAADLVALFFVDPGEVVFE